MYIFALLSILITLAALFGLFSHRVLRLPTSVGTTILSLCAAGLILLSGKVDPGLHTSAAQLVNSINFKTVVLHGMLAFLLFAGALHLDVEELSRQKLAVSGLALLGTCLSIGVVAALFKALLQPLGFPLGWIDALLFGALISPTDPIAVLEMLTRVGAPAALEAKLAGESLFNDGLGAVVFLTLLDATASGALPTVGEFSMHLLLDAVGAVALGAALGYMTYRLLLLANSYRIGVMLTLAVAMGGYSLADALHLSAPLEVVTAGIVVSGRARALAMSKETRHNVDTFWELLDDIFNVVLFLLLGLQLLVLPLRGIYLMAGLLAIPVVLVARLLSVGAVELLLSRFRERATGSIPVLTWGGLRGGLAVALALSLPRASPSRGLLLVTTYVVVVFSIIVQGLTIAPLLRYLGLGSRAAPN